MTIDDVTGLKAFKITNVERLDPILVILQDLGPGKGRIIIECWGSAWTSYFGSIGERSMAEFVAMTDSGYLGGKMSSRRLSFADGKYLKRVCDAVIEACRIYAASEKGER